MTNQHSFQAGPGFGSAMAMPLALILCILASRTAVPVLAATSCPDYLVNRMRCNPVNDIVGPSAPTCQDDPDFYIENLGWWFLKQTQLNPPNSFRPPKSIMVSCLLNGRLFGSTNSKLHFHLCYFSSFFCLGWRTFFNWVFQQSLLPGMLWSGVLNVDFQSRCLVENWHILPARWWLAIFPLSSFQTSLKTLLL